MNEMSLVSYKNKNKSLGSKRENIKLDRHLHYYCTTLGGLKRNYSKNEKDIETSL